VKIPRSSINSTYVAIFRERVPPFEDSTHWNEVGGASRLVRKEEEEEDRKNAYVIGKGSGDDTAIIHK